MAAEEFDTDWTETPICPHCGQEDQDWWDGLGKKDDGDDWTTTCNCGKEYLVTMHVSYNFCTEKPLKVIQQ